MAPLAFQGLEQRGASWHVLALVVCALALSYAGVDAQGGLSVRSRRDLVFGTVIRGIPSVVAPFDRAAGRFEIRGGGNTEIQIDLTLPLAMTDGGTAELPLSFGSNDGAYGFHPQGAGARAFDPQLPLTTTFDRRGKVYVFLGGTALPTGAQPAGSYAAAISLTVSYTGN